MNARVAIALLALGACVADDEQTSTTSAELQNGNVWDPWTQTTQTWTRNIVRLPGCNGILLDYEWVLIEAGCIPDGADASDIEVEHKLADGSVETGVGWDLYGPGDDTLDVRLLRLAGPMHGVAALPIAGGTTDDLIGQTVFCASYGGTTQMRSGSFSIIESLYFPTTAYELDVPNANGQLGVASDRGMPCWNGAGLTGLQKASDSVDYNLHTSLPAARDWIRSLVTPPIIKEVNASGTSCRAYSMHQPGYTSDGAIMNVYTDTSRYPIACPIMRPGTAGNGSDVISAPKVWVRDGSPGASVCCHLFAHNPTSGADVEGSMACTSEAGVSSEPQQLTLGSIVAPAGYHASLYCMVPGNSGIEAYRVRLADWGEASAPPASSIKTTLPGNGCAASSGGWVDPGSNGEMGNFSTSSKLNLVCPVHRTTAPTLTTTVGVTVAVRDPHPDESVCCQLLAQRPGAWPSASTQQCSSGASGSSQTLYLPSLTETDPLARFYVRCTLPRFHDDAGSYGWSRLQRLTIDQD